MRFQPSKGAILAATFFVLASATPAWSQSTQGGAVKRGAFIGVTFIPQFTFDGETFDGQSYYKQIDGEELSFLPKLDKQDVFRPVLGYRGRQASLEISYDHTSHKGVFVGERMDATFNSINVDGRFFVLPKSRIQPYVLVGGSVPWLNVKNGSFLDGKFADAHFKGYGLTAEGGVTIYPLRQFGISVGYGWRRIWFERVTGVSEKLFDLRPRFRETTDSLVISSHYIF